MGIFISSESAAVLQHSLKYCTIPIVFISCCPLLSPAGIASELKDIHRSSPDVNINYIKSLLFQRIAAFIRRGVRRGFCSPDLPSTEELVSDMDDKLFNCILSETSCSVSTPSTRVSLWLHTQTKKT